MKIRVSSNSPRAKEAASRAAKLFSGEPVRVEFRPSLTRLGGRLLSGANRGRAVHAAAYLRRRRIVLETELLEHSGELRRILLHELFHFAWVRLGNPARRVWEGLLHAELAARARGELGWSAEHRKSTLTANDRRLRTRRWREYVCESFCDSGACFLSGQARHEEFTLASRFRSRRSLWFQNLPAGGRIPI